MRALLLLLVFFFLNFTPDERPPNQVNQNPYSDNLLGEVETLFVPADNRGRFMVKPKGNSQPMQFCNLIPGQTYRIFAVKGENCEPKVSFEGGSEEQVLQFVRPSAGSSEITPNSRILVSCYVQGSMAV